MSFYGLLLIFLSYTMCAFPFLSLFFLLFSPLCLMFHYSLFSFLLFNVFLFFPFTCSSLPSLSFLMFNSAIPFLSHVQLCHPFPFLGSTQPFLSFLMFNSANPFLSHAQLCHAFPFSCSTLPFPFLYPFPSLFS